MPGRKQGCFFALDDFGSGLSSFNSLKSLEIDYLKIDVSFVKDMLTDPKDQLIVDSIHRVSRGMQIKNIAEFVENKEILLKLKKIGVDFTQGFHSPGISGGIMIHCVNVTPVDATLHPYGIFSLLT